MRVLVTGSAGFIGSHLVKALSRKHSVVGFDISDSPSQDVRSLAAVKEAAKGADAIVHLAALTLDSESVKIPGEYLETNVIGTFNVLEAAHKLGVRIVLNASSAAVEGSSPYGTSKMCGELLCGSYANTYGMLVASLRFFNVYGTGNDKGVIRAFVERVRAGEPVTVHDDGEYVRDYVNVRDVVSAIENYLDGKFVPGTYEVGTAAGTTVNDLVKVVERVTGRKVVIEHERTSYKIVRSSVAKKPCVANPVRLEDGLVEMWKEWKG